MSWAEIIKAINSSITTKKSESLDVMLKRLIGTSYKVVEADDKILTINSTSGVVNTVEPYEEELIRFRTLYSGNVRINIPVEASGTVQLTPSINVYREKENGDLILIETFSHDGGEGTFHIIGNIPVKYDETIVLKVYEKLEETGVGVVVVHDGGYIGGSLVQNILIAQGE